MNHEEDGFKVDIDSLIELLLSDLHLLTDVRDDSLVENEHVKSAVHLLDLIKHRQSLGLLSHVALHPMNAVVFVK